ncbi:MAG: HAD family hydrolase [Candidatus Thorarchaeota archaeon]
MAITGIEAIIFDLGGTLYRPARNLVELTQQHLSECGVTGYSLEQIEKSLLQERVECLDHFMIKNNVEPHWEPTREDWLYYDIHFLRNLGLEENLEEIAEQYQQKWDAYLENVRNQLINGCKQTLEDLKAQGYTLGIASNRIGDPAIHLERDDILELFDAIEYTFVPGYAKPSPYMLLKVAKLLETNPMNCIYVGNIVGFDVIAAQRADMTPVLLTWCDPDETEKAPENTIMISHIRELLRLVQ